ncbi:MAG: hypothetical protein ABIP51_22350 [Bacteroidia bacterium]
MKNTFKTILLSLLTILLLSQCKKNQITYNAYFYTTNPSAEVQLSLYIDDKYRGDLPCLYPKPTCDNDTLKQKALFLTLKSGKYKISAKDRQGNIKSSGTMKVSKNKMSSSGGMGGQEISSQSDCLIVGLFY